MKLDHTHIIKVQKLAQEIHVNQKRKFGDKEPYFNHVDRVAKRVMCDPDCTIEAIIAAYLHDAMEDQDYPLEQIEEDFGFEVGSAVQILTHEKNENYAQYICYIKRDHIARIVKMADLCDNGSDKNLKEGSLKDKYRLAHMFLSGESKRPPF